VIIAGSLLAVIYIWQVVERAYLAKPPAETSRAEAPASMLIPAWLLAIANLYFGSHTDLSVGIAARAAASLFGVAP
jgi:multicomponent Na+:H+ antiporter subunit D